VGCAGSVGGVRGQCGWGARAVWVGCMGEVRDEAVGKNFLIT